MKFDTTPIAVIGCSKEKLGRGAPAIDLYTGPLFKMRLELARAAGAETIYIASALHNIVRSDEWVQPYEWNLQTSSKGFRDSWTKQAAESLRLVLHASDGPVLALVSGPYAGWVPVLRGHGHKVTLVGDGLPIGKLRQEMKRLLAACNEGT